MTDDEFKKEVQEFVMMLENLRRIKDKGRRKWLKAELRVLLTRLMND